MHLSLLLDFTRQDFIERYSGSALGTLWVFIHPLVMIFIFTVIFADIMHTKLIGGGGSHYDYTIYLVSGLLPWLAFANTITRCSTVFLDKRHIISKIRLTLAYLPLYVVLSEGITFAITLLLFLGFLLIIAHPFSAWLLLVPFIFILQQLMAFSLGLLFGILNVFLRDIKEIVSVLLTFWFWLTPIVWVPTIAPVWLQQAQTHVNPTSWFIDAYRALLLHHRAPDWLTLTQLIIVAHALLLLAWFVLRRLEKDVRDFL